MYTFLYSTLEGLYPPFLYAPANGPSMNLELLSSKGLWYIYQSIAPTYVFLQGEIYRYQHTEQNHYWWK